jgi:hypothetical protein
MTTIRSTTIGGVDIPDRGVMAVRLRALQSAAEGATTIADLLRALESAPNIFYQKSDDQLLVPLGAIAPGFVQGLGRLFHTQSGTGGPGNLVALRIQGGNPQGNREPSYNNIDFVVQRPGGRDYVSVPNDKVTLLFNALTSRLTLHRLLADIASRLAD